MATYGYARVSAQDQDLSAQLAALKAAGCERIYSEKVSGAAARLGERRELGRALKALQPGDTLLVTRLERLARSTRDLLNILAAIGDAGATFKSLGDAWADTTTAHGRLMLTVLDGLAEFERHLIRSRTTEGRKRAQANGVKIGRPLKLTPHQRKEALQRVEAGEPLRAIALSYAVDHSTISRLRVRQASEMT